MPMPPLVTPAGDFRHRISIVSRIGGQTNELGERVPADFPVMSNVPAKVRPLSAREILANAENTLSVSHEVRLRYTANINHASWIYFRGRRLEVVSIFDINEDNRELSILCDEQKP